MVQGLDGSDPIDYLFGLERFGLKFGLDNISTLCAALGNPELACRSIIVAGTNGKGSVTAMLDTSLRAAGLRVARYTSPHLVRLEERFVINGSPVETDVLRAAAAELRTTVERLRACGDLTAHPTFFEMTTAMAFYLFRLASVELAVLEVGLGGRFDATNVAKPVAAAITAIDMDHERYLGYTIGDIAYEKAGVIKPGMLVVVGETKPEALVVFEQACRERDARLILARDGVTARVHTEAGRIRLDLHTRARSYGTITLGLRGRHQVDNAIVALRLLEELDTFGIQVPAEAIVAGLSKTIWRGRLDLVRMDEEHSVLLDAAHNPAGARSLAAYLHEVHPEGLPVIFGVMRDKDAAAMLSALAPCATRFVFTEPRAPRAASVEELARIARSLECISVQIERDPRRALDLALSTAPLVCATGSIFLVGEILAALERETGAKTM